MEHEQSTLMVVDCLNMAFSFRGQHDYSDKYIDMVRSLRRSYKAGKVVLANDQSSSAYRKAIYPEYKGNREEMRAKQTDIERQQFELFFKEFKVAMKKLEDSGEFPVIQFNKTEADDIAAYITKKRKNYGIAKVVLISSDRDWDLLVADDVMRFSYVTRKETTVDNWDSHYDCTPEEYISIKCLQGDTGDNIPGVPKIGPKTAKKLVDAYGTALDIASAIPLPGKYVYITNLNNFGAENIIRNYELMDLLTFCEEALGENTKEIDRIMNEYCSA